MIRFELFSGLLVLALCVYCLIEVIGTPDGEVRNLPKVGWILLVLFFPLVGSVAWLVAGRPERARQATRGAGAAFPEYDRPGRMVATDTASDEEFLKQVRERAEEQRRLYRERKKAEEQGDS